MSCGGTSTLLAAARPAPWRSSGLKPRSAPGLGFREQVANTKNHRPLILRQNLMETDDIKDGNADGDRCELFHATLPGKTISARFYSNPRDCPGIGCHRAVFSMVQVRGSRRGRHPRLPSRAQLASALGHSPCWVHIQSQPQYSLHRHLSALRHRRRCHRVPNFPMHKDLATWSQRVCAVPVSPIIPSIPARALTARAFNAMVMRNTVMAPAEDL